MNKLSLCFLVIISTLQLTAQDLHDLDHDSKTGFVKSLHSYQGGFIYTTSNNDGVATRVIHVDNFGNRKVLFEHYAWHGNAKYYEHQDGSIDVYLYDIIDYDIPGSWMYHLAYDGTTVTDTSEIRNSDSFERLEDGSFRIRSWSSAVLQLSPDGKTVGTIEEIIPKEIIQDVHENIYYFTSLGVMIENNGSVELVEEISQRIFGVKYFEEVDRFMINTDSSLLVYENEFSNLILSVKYPEGYWLRNGMHYYNDKYYLALIDANNIGTLWTYETANGFIEIHDGAPLNINLDFIEIENDEIFLGYGYTDESRMALVSKFPLGEEPEYDLVDISLDDIEIELDSSEFVFDTEFTEYFRYYFNAKFTVTNHGDERINSFDLYSKEFTGLIFILMQRNFSLSVENANLEPGNSKEFIGVLDILSPSPPKTANMFIQGANHKIDSDMSNNFIEVDQINALNDEGAKSIIYIYPNPVLDMLYVNGVPTQTTFDFAIYDIMGKVYKNGKYTNESGISVSDLRSGIYFMKGVNRDGNQFVKKIIKN